MFGFSGKPFLKTGEGQRAAGGCAGGAVAEVSEIDVWQAANQLIWQFPEYPVLKAGPRAECLGSRLRSGAPLRIWKAYLPILQGR